MPKFRFFFLTLSLLVIFSQVAYAKVDTMTVSELSPGMKGIGRTVISGTQVEEFNVVILGVLTKGGFNGGPMILIKCSGSVIERSGGVAGGYSGSPIFINGKMIGALSAGWNFADHTIAGVTPINEMLKNFNYPDEPGGEIKLAKLDSPIEVFGREIDSSVLCMDSSEAQLLSGTVGENTMVLTACKTPLFVNGLNPELFEMAKTKLSPLLPYMEIISGPGSGMATNGLSVPIYEGPTEMEPGSAIGMQIVSGDIDMTAVGTLTWVDRDDPEKKILAFGHPFLQKGRLSAPITSARIVYTVPAIDRSFKIGEAINIIGTTDQDRACAVSGMLGKMPDLVKIHFTMTDKDQDRTKRFEFGVLRDEDLLPFLALLPMMQGMSYVIDRSGQATASIDFSIKGEGLADPVERKNIYFSTSGATNVFMEPLEILSLLTSANVFREVKITDIDINVQVTENRQTLDIVEIQFLEDNNKVPADVKSDQSATVVNTADSNNNDITELLGKLQDVPQGESQNVPPQKVIISQGLMQGDEIKSFKPGDIIKVKATIKPYREETFDEILTLKIPENINPGTTQIEVRGGGGLPNQFMQASSPMLMTQINIMQMPIAPGFTPEEPPKTLDEIIDKLLERDHNNDLIIELRNPPPTDPKQIAKMVAEGEKAEKPIKQIKTTDKVIYGIFQLPLEIKKPGEEKKSEDKKAQGEDKKSKDSKKSKKSSYKPSFRNTR